MMEDAPVNTPGAYNSSNMFPEFLTERCCNREICMFIEHDP